MGEGGWRHTSVVCPPAPVPVRRCATLACRVQGVPPTQRNWVWMETSGARAKKQAHAQNYYQIMVKTGHESPFNKDIAQVTGSGSRGGGRGRRRAACGGAGVGGKRVGGRAGPCGVGQGMD